MNNNKNAKEKEQPSFKFSNHEDRDSVEIKFVPPLTVKQKDVEIIVGSKTDADVKRLHELKFKRKSAEIEATEIKISSQLDLMTNQENTETLRTNVKFEYDLNDEKMQFKLEPQELCIKEEGDSSSSDTDYEKAEGEYLKSSPEQCKTDKADDKPFKCNICSFTTKYRHSLRTHMSTHSGEKPFECGICSYRCTWAVLLRKHIMSLHMERPFKCSACNCSFDSKIVFDLHLRSHMKRVRKGKNCDYSCKQAPEMRQHEATHSVYKPFKCNHCSYTTVRRAVLENHQKIHTVQKLEHVCQVCSFYTVEADQFKKHMEMHASHEKVYRCDQCNYNSKNITVLVAHMKKHIWSQEK